MVRVVVLVLHGHDAVLDHCSSIGPLFPVHQKHLRKRRGRVTLPMTLSRMKQDLGTLSMVVCCAVVTKPMFLVPQSLYVGVVCLGGCGQTSEKCSWTDGTVVVEKGASVGSPEEVMMPSWRRYCGVVVVGLHMDQRQ